MSQLRDAVIVSIRAEWEFRCGPQAYSAVAAKRYEDANAEVRRLVTDETDVTLAGAALGKRIEAVKKRKRSRLIVEPAEPVQMSLFER